MTAAISFSDAVQSAFASAFSAPSAEFSLAALPIDHIQKKVRAEMPDLRIFPSLSPMNITVFKAGRMLGPLNPSGLADLIARGEVSENDLAQRDGVEVWVPVHRLVPRRTEPTRWDRSFEKTRKWGLGFWAALHFNPLRIGLACLLGGCVLTIVGDWTFPLFVPAFSASVFAGAILLTRRRFATGSLLSTFAIALPAVFLLAGRDGAKSTRTGSAMPPPSIESVIQRPNLTQLQFPPKPKARTSLSGLALPQPVVPTPAPRPVPPI